MRITKLSNDITKAEQTFVNLSEPLYSVKCTYKGVEAINKVEIKHSNHHLFGDWSEWAKW